MASIPVIGAKPPMKIDPTAPNRVIITFTDDHNIAGAKFEIMNVSAEQIAVAIFYLTRSANQMKDMETIAAMQDQSALAAAAGALAREKSS